MVVPRRELLDAAFASLEADFRAALERGARRDAATPADAARDAVAAQRARSRCFAAYKLLISPLFAGSCRFLPSCSDYAAEAVARARRARGVWLAARRLARCHPLGGRAGSIRCPHVHATSSTRMY